jgi:hypothetical protein
MPGGIFMRGFILLAAASIIIGCLLFPSQARADDDEGIFEGLAIGAGINRATENNATEEFAFGIKYMASKWEYGFDFIQSGPPGLGPGSANSGFVWAAWLNDFKRTDWQDYGVYVGAGAGILLFQDNFIDWPAGPFAVIGWDFTERAGMEGKLGYFGENYFGTAMLYWYFE